jgi:2-oxo-4-hydroxy-4-carboxy-5-ureidoimidazoline decarboxylase
MADQISVCELVSKDAKEISEILGGIYEHSPWVASILVQDVDAVSALTTVSELASAMKEIVEKASRDQKLALLCAHPDLCEKVAKLKELTKESQEEQSKAGLQTMEGEELAKFNALNTQYRETFKFPFILAVRNATKYTVLSALGGRVSNSPEKEFATALEQVHKIAWMRLLTNFYSSDFPGFLTCHVLDTCNGCPGKFFFSYTTGRCHSRISFRCSVVAMGMRIQLTRLSPPESAGVVGDFITNEDGRLEGGPALKGKEFMVGTYEWTFYAGDYFASRGTFTSGQPFLDVIPLRFGIDNPDDHYHVPLLVSPWSFSTYRGS